MEKLKPFDSLTISRCNSESSSLSDPIPPDVLMEIISELPAKSVAKCRCVSKLWALILGRPEFEELFLTKSLSRPQFLFTFLYDYVVAGVPFFTSPQIQNPNHDNSSSLVATPRPTYLPPALFTWISQPLRGWVCIEDQRKMLVICNPLTGKAINLPPLPRPMSMWVKSVLGYDPIEKQFKVFYTTWLGIISRDDPIPADHYVLTLGTEPLVWRAIESCKPVRPVGRCDDGICINGVLYYLAELNRRKNFVIVCFDIRSEKLSFINKPKDMWSMVLESRLINHKGQLGIILTSNRFKVDGYTTNLGLWVLTDIEKHEWTFQLIALPPLWLDVVAETELDIVGMTGTCEIVLSPTFLFGPFYLFYYNLERNIVRRVGIQGFEVFNHRTALVARCFLDYVENLNLI